MATEKKKLEFEDIPIDNTDIFIRNVPKDITMSMAKLIFPNIQKHFDSQNNP